MERTEAHKALEDIYSSERLARIAIDHITDDKGEILARVWESAGFQDIYGYKGIERKRHRLKRKQEQVYNQLDSQKQLFQKVYYCPTLSLADEQVLREAFFKYNKTHDQMKQISAIGHLTAYFPLTYWISKRVRPTGVLLWTLFYYAGVYRSVGNLVDQSFQSNLNSVAERIAGKYGVKKLNDYLKE